MLLETGAKICNICFVNKCISTVLFSQSMLQTGNVVKLTSKTGVDLCVYTGDHGLTSYGHGGYGAETPANGNYADDAVYMHSARDLYCHKT